MDYIQGTTLAQRKQLKGSYDKSDVKAAAAAVQQLINIKMPPGTAPGPIGGGVIGHNFFLECYSALRYPSANCWDRVATALTCMDSSTAVTNSLSP